MEIEIDKRSGFCFGVRNAVEIAEKALLKGEKVYSLGSIVHNDIEVARLDSLGLVHIDHAHLSQLRDCKVLIRAHGEPPGTYATARKNNITIIEATCPIVKRLQSRIRETWIRTRENNEQIVIFGKPGHAEVIGLLGQTDNQGILVSGPKDIENIDFSKPVHLFSQTTMKVADYRMITNLLKSGFISKGITDTEEMLHVHNTICRQVSNREPHLKAFANKHDVIIFVSGRESSNGRMLYSVCKSVNPGSYFVTAPEEIEVSWFENKRSAGICGATSTPKWLIEKVYDHVSKIKSISYQPPVNSISESPEKT
ncbi:MAG: 4-hydroxy-3-methylbut-2-enyl diphosphate reductase [Bacteroidales bacterium]|jgi:4-hydroxy-3-methylbut-2-enyl diphosphate reductase|nr:4-hydroxy-3-methylbut-2-enyl diphosphate reductase [Bacteroidales bacterium]